MKSRMSRHAAVFTNLFLAACLLSQAGCSVVMAAKQPPKRDLAVLDTGTPRNLVLAELGQPIASEARDSRKVDVFSFTQGYSKPAKAGRALFHGAADVFTFGLWEVVGTPTEAVFDGTKMALEVTYDENDRVMQVVNLGKPASGDTAAQKQESKQVAKEASAPADTNFTHRTE